MRKLLRSIATFFKYLFRYISRTLLFLTLIIVTVGILGSVFLGFKLYPVLMEAKEISYDKLLTIDDNTFTGLKDTIVYNNKGEVLTEINIGNYEYVDIEDVSKWITEGYIAVEDQRFKTHNGIDFKGIGRAAVDMAKAYSTLANYGEYSDALCVTKIEYQNEGSVFDGELKYTQVYEPDAAYMVLDSLKSNMTEYYGLGRGLNVKNAIVGAKSGTTNSQKDAWYCGVSKYYTLTVWCGYDTPKPTGMYGSGAPGKIWNKAMTELHEGLEVVDFERPTTITEQSINWKGEYVDYNSGKKDLYSQTLIDKAERERLEKLEQERVRKENLEIDNLISEIENFSDYKVKDESSIKYIEDGYTSLSNRILKIQNENKRVELQISLDIVMAVLEEDLLPIKEQIKQAAIKEEEKRQEKLEMQIKTILYELSNLQINTELDINSALGYEKDATSLLLEIRDISKVNNFRKQLEEVMALQNIDILKLQNEIEIEKQLKKEQRKLLLQQEIEK